VRSSCAGDRPIGPLAHLPRQHRRIEDQDDLSIPKIGGAGDPVHPHERVADGSHHDLPLADDAIHCDPDRSSTGADYEEVQPVARGLGKPEQPGEPDDRQRRAAIRHHLIALDLQQGRDRHLDDGRGIVGEHVDFVVLRPAQIVNRRPATYRELYMLSAGYCPGLSWKILAAIGQIESGHGRNVGPSSAGALGPMQFLPSTWASYGVDGDGDGKADIMSAYDAVPAAALYLCRNGAGRGGQDLYNAIFNYNHADWYVREVLALAARYR